MEILKFKLSKDQEIWLNELYKYIKKYESPNYRKIKIDLIEKISHKFKPQSIDRRLIRWNADLTLLGVWTIDPESQLIKDSEKLLYAIKEIVYNNPTDYSISIDVIKKATNFSKEQIKILLNLINSISNFWSSFGGDTLDIQNDAFEKIIAFKGLEDWLEKFYFKYEYKTNNIEINRSDSNSYELKVNPIFKSKVCNIDPSLCFIIMPFTEEWSTGVFNKLKSNVEHLGFQCIRADVLSGPIIMEDIWTKINQCAFLIADVTNKNPNVMYELGIAHTLGKPVILITQDTSSIPFDFKHLRHEQYTNTLEGFKKLEEKLPSIIKRNFQEYYNQELNL